MSIQSSEIRNEEKDLPFRMSYIPEFARRKCEVELNETPERKKQCVQELREILANDKATKTICFHEDLLVQYLRHSKYNTKKALTHLRNLNAIRNKEAKMFESIPDEYFLTKPSTKFIIILPKRSPDGCTMVMSQMGKWDPNELGFEDFKRMILMTFQQLLRDPMTQINGIKLIHDFAGTTLEHIKYCSPQNLYLFYYMSIVMLQLLLKNFQIDRLALQLRWKDFSNMKLLRSLCCVFNNPIFQIHCFWFKHYCIPGRYKEIHFINETPVLRFLWAVIKKFLSAKIRGRVYFHSHTEELLDYFPKSVLPAQCGGELLDMHSTNFVETANKEQKENAVEGQPNFF